MIDSEDKLLIDMLLEAGALTEDELADGRRLQESNDGSLKDALLDREYISQEDIRMLSQAAEWAFHT